MATTTTTNNVGRTTLTAARISQGIKLSVAQKLVAQCKQGALARAELQRLQQKLQEQTPTGRAAKLAGQLEDLSDDFIDRAHQLQRSAIACSKIAVIVGLPALSAVVAAGILAHASPVAFGLLAVTIPAVLTVRAIIGRTA